MKVRCNKCAESRRWRARIRNRCFPRKRQRDGVGIGSIHLFWVLFGRFDRFEWFWLVKYGVWGEILKAKRNSIYWFKKCHDPKSGRRFQLLRSYGQELDASNRLETFQNGPNPTVLPSQRAERVRNGHPVCRVWFVESTWISSLAPAQSLDRRSGSVRSIRNSWFPTGWYPMTTI